MSVICTSDEARNYRCCMAERECAGANCMAWSVHYAAEIVPNNGPPSVVRPALRQILKKTDKGYCSLCKPVK